jgi:hypothetical protein
MRSHAYGDSSDRDDRDCAECARTSASLLSSASASVNAVNRIWRNGHTQTARVQDVAQPALELLVAVVAHWLRT